MDHRKKEEKNFNSVLNFRRVTHFQMCMLETQVQPDQSCSGKSCTTSQPDQSCIGKSGKPFQPDQFCSGKSGQPPSLINPAQENQVIRQTKKFL